MFDSFMSLTVKFSLAICFHDVFFCQGHNEKVENHKRALPLSIFGDEDKEADELVIHQDSSTSMPSFDLKSSVKNPKVDINDLISSLYGQAVHNTSGIHEQNFSESGLDSSWNGNDGNLASDNIDFDDDSWEFQDAPLGVGDNPCGPVQKYSSKIEQNDYLEFFSKLREELHYTSLYHLENLKVRIRLLDFPTLNPLLKSHK